VAFNAVYAIVLVYGMYMLSSIVDSNCGLMVL